MKPKLLFVLVTVFAVTVLIYPCAAQAKSLPDISGSYFFIEKPPQEFQDIDWISIFTWDGNGGIAPMNGFIRLKRRHQGRFVNYFLINTSLKGRTFTFSTKAVRGISYRFRGRFLKLDNIADDEFVLEGHLQKFRAGRKVAEVDARFSYFSGD